MHVVKMLSLSALASGRRLAVLWAVVTATALRSPQSAAECPYKDSPHGFCPFSLDYSNHPNGQLQLFLYFFLLLHPDRTVSNVRACAA